MAQDKTPIRICLATQNRHKVEELQSLLVSLAPDLAGQVVLTSLGELGIHDDVIEDGATFADNARIKAQAAFARTGAVAEGVMVCYLIRSF